eukprot:2105392-Alexandrium_andersonii.AAC.1
MRQVDPLRWCSAAVSTRPGLPCAVSDPILLGVQMGLVHLRHVHVLHVRVEGWGGIFRADSHRDVLLSKAVGRFSEHNKRWAMLRRWQTINRKPPTRL